MLRLGINPGDNSWLVIERKGEREYVDLREEKVEDVKQRFDAIGLDPQRFAAFVEYVSAGIP